MTSAIPLFALDNDKQSSFTPIQGNHSIIPSLALQGKAYFYDLSPNFVYVPLSCFPALTVLTPSPVFVIFRLFPGKQQNPKNIA